MKFILHITVLIFLSSCANIVTPTGGAKDSESPKLLSSTSDVNENSSEKKLIFFKAKKGRKNHPFQLIIYLSYSHFPVQGLYSRLESCLS